MTSLTYDNYTFLIYSWVAFWCLLCSAVMISRQGKNPSDWEVIGFRFLIGLTCLSVALNYVMNKLRIAPPLTPYWVFIHVSMTGLGWFSMMTCLRVISIVRRQGLKHPERREDMEYPNDETPNEGVERRHREVIDHFPIVGSEAARHDY